MSQPAAACASQPMADNHPSATDIICTISISSVIHSEMFHCVKPPPSSGGLTNISCVHFQQKAQMPHSKCHFTLYHTGNTHIYNSSQNRPATVMLKTHVLYIHARYVKFCSWYSSSFCTIESIQRRANKQLVYQVDQVALKATNWISQSTRYKQSGDKTTFYASTCHVDNFQSTR